ncbi:unnamed protein product [Lactuca saligna]|uniref:Uncharacterized protein n=1 Tax=Lactuca saligna TaxID=75948 RepID=A0AA35VUJ9_LACSI|nr:unnamed protein product [Lactuca saligna]
MNASTTPINTSISLTPTKYHRIVNSDQSLNLLENPRFFGEEDNARSIASLALKTRSSTLIKFVAVGDAIGKEGIGGIRSLPDRGRDGGWKEEEGGRWSRSSILSLCVEFDPQCGGILGGKIAWRDIHRKEADDAVVKNLRDGRESEKLVFVCVGFFLIC